MTREVRITHAGDPEVLTLTERDLPPPPPGHARVRHTAIGVNYIDTYHRSGAYPLPLPHGIGCEAAGTVEALGEGVTLPIGLRVGYVTSVPGTYAEAANVPENRLVALPDDVSDEAAASLLLKGMTVEYLVTRTYSVAAGEWVLLHAAAGGVGLLASQWLRSLGAQVIGTVSTPQKAEVVAQIGVHPVIYTQEDFEEAVTTLTGGAGVSVVYDSVGKATLPRSLRCLKPRGMLVSFGNASGAPEPIDLSQLALHGSLFVTRPTLWHYIARREELLASVASVFQQIRDGHVSPHIGHRYPLSEAATSHADLEARRTTGASILLPRAIHG